MQTHRGEHRPGVGAVKDTNNGTKNGLQVSPQGESFVAKMLLARTLRHQGDVEGMLKQLDECTNEVWTTCESIPHIVPTASTVADSYGT